MAMARRLGSIRRLGSSGDAVRRLLSTGSSAEDETPKAVIHIARPFSYTLRAPTRPALKNEVAPEELAAGLDDIGARVRIRLLGRDEMMPHPADLQALGGVVGPDEIHLHAVHSVDGPDYLHLKRLDLSCDTEARRRTLRRLRSRGILVSRRAPPPVRGPARAIANGDRAARAVRRVGDREDVKDSAAWIVGRLQVMAAKIARGVRDASTN